VVDLFVIHILQNRQRLRTLMLEDKLTIDVSNGVVKAVRGGPAEDSVVYLEASAESGGRQGRGIQGALCILGARSESVPWVSTPIVEESSHTAALSCRASPS
jgi:hypothetical protein